MYDPELQLRFMRSATDAFFGGADALMAASRAWQDALQSSYGMPAAAAPKPVAPMPLEPFAAWSWAFDWVRETPVVAAMKPAAFSWPGMQAAKPAWPMMPTMPLNPMAMPPMWPMSAATSPFGSLKFSADPSAFWSSMVNAYWTLPAISWSLYQGPMTMMLVGTGLPYAIAAPTAKASASALDAADAMRLQTIKSMSFFRTDGGHASAQFFAPTAAAPIDRAAAREAARRQRRS